MVVSCLNDTKKYQPIKQFIWQQNKSSHIIAWRGTRSQRTARASEWSILRIVFTLISFLSDLLAYIEWRWCHQINLLQFSGQFEPQPLNSQDIHSYKKELCVEVLLFHPLFPKPTHNLYLMAYARVCNASGVKHPRITSRRSVPVHPFVFFNMYYTRP